MTTYNGGFYDYANRVTKDIFFRKDEDRETKQGVIKSGQVLKARTLLQSDTDGKLIAHTGLSETALVAFATITTGQTQILGGLTFTAGSGSVTASQLATIWADLPAGITAADANTLLLARGINATTVGTFTSGTLTGWNTSTSASADKVLFVSTGGLHNVTNLGLSTTASITATGGNAGQAVITTASTTGAGNGYEISGPGIPEGTTIVSFVANTSITLSNNLTVNAVNTASAYTINYAGMGTATAPTITTTAGVSTFPMIAGITMYDVDASGGDIQAEVWAEASFWADALTWQVDTAIDTITIHDGTTVACTAYNTGTTRSDAASTNLLRAKFVENTEFEPLGFLTAGDVYND